jgi:4-alpha-glucanotransferase
MALDDFSWWRQRMAHMGNYFDAIRIDHVLGFFRIWSIPYGAIEGILGKFEPSWPVSHEDISNAGVHFSEERFCEPYITEQLLHDWFGTNAAVVKDTFLTSYRFMEEFNSQRKVAEYLKTNPTHIHLKNGLFDLLSNIIAIKDGIHPYNYHFRINMHDTESFKALPFHEKEALRRLYDVYYYEKQNQLWEEEGVKKLTALKRSTNMLICAEDLGMVPVMVEGVLNDMQMLALEVQRMPKKINELFSNPAKSPYLSVVTPSTHDMSTIREWWQEDYDNSTVFLLKQLGYHGETPASASTWLCQEVIDQHLQSPAMWAVFLLQDLLSMDEGLRIDDPQKERINNPADPNHFWNYRMYITLEKLKKQKGYIEHLKQMIEKSGR